MTIRILRRILSAHRLWLKRYYANYLGGVGFLRDIGVTRLMYGSSFNRLLLLAAFVYPRERRDALWSWQLHYTSRASLANPLSCRSPETLRFMKVWRPSLILEARLVVVCKHMLISSSSKLIARRSIE